VSATLEVVVRPRAKRRGIEGRRADGRLKLAVTAPPEDGKANEAVAALLAESLGVKARDVAVVQGHGSRQKRIEVQGLEQGECERRIEAALGGARQR
jgi:uncharacterized protein (TIGR00251 family)